MILRRFVLLICFITIHGVYAQVGIGTQDPQAMLDVNGNMRIQFTDIGSMASAKDSILVLNGVGLVKRIPAVQAMNSIEKSLIKGGFAGANGGLVTINLNAWQPLKFNAIEFDTHGEYNIADYTYTAKSKGIFRVNAKITMSAVFAGDIGLAVYKIDAQQNEKQVAVDRYSNIRVNVLNLIDVNVNPPSRSIHTLVQLDQGEHLQFKVRNSVSISLSSAITDSYFTIEQVGFQ